MTSRIAPTGALLSTVAFSTATFIVALTATSATAQKSPVAEDKLPTAQLKVPQGFRVETYIHGLPDARSLRLGDKGTVFVSNRDGDKVYAVVTQGAKREAKVIASKLDRPDGHALQEGTLYIADDTEITAPVKNI